MIVIVESLWCVQVVFCEVLASETDVIKNDFNFTCRSNYSEDFQTFIFVILIKERDSYDSNVNRPK